MLVSSELGETERQRENERETERKDETLRLVLVLRQGLQFGDLSDAFGNSVSKQQLGSHFEVLRMLDELESCHCFLTCAQLLLTQRMIHG